MAASHVPATPLDLAIRPLAGDADYAACVDLQRRTWGESFTELVPANLLQIAQKVGGVAAGAFDAAGTLVGFVFGLTGVRDGAVVHWSHMLAVREDARDRGVGRALKQFQRSRLRELQVDRVYWTFDPLVARNAHLNLERLGAEVVEYVQDMYGSDTGSSLHSGLGTDRLVVMWRLNRARRQSAVPANWASAPCVDGGPDDRVDAAAGSIRIEIPEDVQVIRERDSAEAVRWRSATRAAFLEWLGRGWRVAGLVRDRDVGRCWYVLTPGDGRAARGGDREREGGVE